MGVYNTLLDAIWMQVEKGYEQKIVHCIAEGLNTEVYVSKALFEPEGMRFYALLGSILEAAGWETKYSRRKLIFIHAAELLYISADDEDISEDDKQMEKEDFGKVKDGFNKIVVPKNPMLNELNDEGIREEEQLCSRGRMEEGSSRNGVIQGERDCTYYSWWPSDDVTRFPTAPDYAKCYRESRNPW